MVEKLSPKRAGTERAERITTEGCNQNNQTMVLAIPSYYSTQPEFADSIATGTRLANRADAAIVTARNLGTLMRTCVSINSASSSQSFAENLACCGPYNSATAEMKEASSRSARRACSSQIESHNDSSSLNRILLLRNQPKVNENALTPESRN
jgi:hypothetical protein